MNENVVAEGFANIKENIADYQRVVLLRILAYY